MSSTPAACQVCRSLATVVIRYSHHALLCDTCRSDLKAALSNEPQEEGRGMATRTSEDETQRLRAALVEIRNEVEQMKRVGRVFTLRQILSRVLDQPDRDVNRHGRMN